MIIFERANEDKEVWCDYCGCSLRASAYTYQKQWNTRYHGLTINRDKEIRLEVSIRMLEKLLDNQDYQEKTASVIEQAISITDELLKRLNMKPNNSAIPRERPAGSDIADQILIKKSLGIDYD